MRDRLKVPFIVASIFSSLIFIYFTYSSVRLYKTFKTVEMSDVILSTLYRYESLLKSIESECFLSAKYLGNQESIDLSKVKRAIEMVDSKLEDISSKLPSLSEDLKYVRVKVDHLDSDIKEIVFDYYDKNIETLLLESINEELNTLSLIEPLSSNLKSYKEYLYSAKTLNRKNSVIAYILSQKSVADKRDIEILDKTLIYPQNLYEDEKKLQHFNIDIINKALINDKKLSFTMWHKEANKIYTKHLQMSKTQLQAIQDKIKNISVDPDLLLKKIALALLFFILTIIFTKKFLEIRHKKEFKIKKDELMKDEVELSASLGKKSLKTKSEKSLSQINDKESSTVEDSGVLRAFNPLDKFTKVAHLLEEGLEKVDIAFKYYIDPSIPTQSISNVSKLDKMITIIVDHILELKDIDNFIEYDAQVVAQNRVEIAVNLRFFIKKDMGGLNSLKLKQLAHFIGANFQEISIEDRSKEINLTFNLKI